MSQAEVIRVTGTVQGVGFRPFVWQLAAQLNITGDVNNDGQGVLIHAWASQATLDTFAQRLKSEAPPLAVVDSITRSPLSQLSPPAGFSIVASKHSQAATGVVADAATCPACLSEVFDPANRRYGYPFTNCTHCGPRFSIIKRIPYDRANTSMAAFTQCPSCQSEYSNPADRRFHAQPNACAQCGPQLWLEDNLGNKMGDGIGDGIEDNSGNTNHHAIDRAAQLIQQGYIVAIKGIGGIHLAVDACNSQAVDKLRARKQRYGKPLALMARDEAQIRQYAELSPQHSQAIASPAAPIVLLPQIQPANTALALGVAPNQNQLGFMLPYSPLHHWLLRKLNSPIVLTSGNRSDEPQCIGNQEALERLADIADYFLLHNRDIINRLDDSVVQIMGGKQTVMRRARGFAPQPIKLPPGFNAPKTVLALGADLKNTVCFAKDGHALLSQHIGDLENPSAQLDFRHTIELLAQLFQSQPDIIATDKHPNYLSAAFGVQQAAEKNLDTFAVQHHHAHIAAAMIDAGLPANSEPLLGIALDGLGFGDDGSFWGGEILLANYQKSLRVARLQPVSMLGGNVAMREPWRNTLAHLFASGVWQTLAKGYKELSITEFLSDKPIAILQKMAAQQLNSPASSSAGRLFDAVAALLNLCREQQTYEGQAATQLQTLAEEYRPTGSERSLPFDILNTSGLMEISWQRFWPEILQRLKTHSNLPQLAWLFHLTLAQAVTRSTTQLAQQHRVQTVMLSGGVAHNRLLSEMIIQRLDSNNLHCHIAGNIPSNDGGIALGQAAIALANLK
ncbi:carbamoyltransferase HypF [Halioxenophilus aromaticivorans]|uniref:Carbamoyltransferase HypF n=1 Tax=Halioxenophilus aromaticivorans TaxID=1306992 RepID=A0AAV3UA71_9ALTE